MHFFRFSLVLSGLCVVIEESWFRCYGICLLQFSPLNPVTLGFFRLYTKTLFVRLYSWFHSPVPTAGLVENSLWRIGKNFGPASDTLPYFTNRGYFCFFSLSLFFLSFSLSLSFTFFTFTFPSFSYFSPLFLHHFIKHVSLFYIFMANTLTFFLSIIAS